MTLEALERRLRAAVQDERVKIRLQDKWDSAANLEWEGDGARGALVTVDPYQRGLIYLVVHELVHWINRHDAESLGETEEPQFDGLSVEVTRRIEGSKRRTAWWRSAIRTKLRGAV